MSDEAKKDNGANDPWANPRSVQEAAAPSTEATSTDDGALKKRIQDLLDQQINPSVASHGGHIGLVDVQGDKVFVQMSGGCQGCGAARLTLKAGVERILKEEIPEISEVIDATDHGQGHSPYYSPPK